MAGLPNSVLFTKINKTNFHRESLKKDLVLNLILL